MCKTKEKEERKKESSEKRVYLAPRSVTYFWVQKILSRKQWLQPRCNDTPLYESIINLLL